MGKDERNREALKRRVYNVLVTRPITLDLSAAAGKSGDELIDELIERIAELVEEDISNDFDAGVFEPGALCARCGRQREEHKPLLLCVDEVETMRKLEQEDPKP